MKQQTLSSNELAVLQILWEADHALSRPEMLEKIPENHWNPNSIHVVLNNLIKKGYIEVEGVTRCGRGYGRTYRAIKTRVDYAADQALQALPDASDEEHVLTLMSAMVKRKNVSATTITLLEQMLDARRKELQQQDEQEKDRN